MFVEHSWIRHLRIKYSLSYRYCFQMTPREKRKLLQKKKRLAKKVEKKLYYEGRKRKTQHLEKVWICPECDAPLTSECGKKRHMEMHRGIYPYECPYCLLGIRSSSYMKVHLRVHAGRMIGFSCASCDHNAETFKAFKEHIATCGVVQFETNSLNPVAVQCEESNV